VYLPAFVLMFAGCMWLVCSIKGRSCAFRGLRATVVLLSSSKHLCSDDIMMNNREDYQNCSVLCCCVTYLCLITSTIIRVLRHSTRLHCATLSHYGPSAQHDTRQKEKRLGFVVQWGISIKQSFYSLLQNLSFW